MEPPDRPFTALPYRAFTPWLLVTEVPPGERRVLRYGVRYDEHWTAFARTKKLPHVRVDTVVNGWLLPAFDRSARVVLVETGALLVALSELVSAVVQLTLLASLLRRPIRTGAS
jgi:hypothetical protein